jgi:hypothetical protein
MRGEWMMSHGSRKSRSTYSSWLSIITEQLLNRYEFFLDGYVLLWMENEVDFDNPFFFWMRI